MLLSQLSSGLVGDRAAPPSLVRAAWSYIAGRQSIPQVWTVRTAPRWDTTVGTAAPFFKTARRTIAVTSLRHFVVRASYLQGAWSGGVTSTYASMSAVLPIPDLPCPSGTSGLRQMLPFVMQSARCDSSYGERLT